MDTKDAGRLGGIARAAQLTPEEYREMGIRGGTNRWADKTPEERSAHARMMAAAPRKPRTKKVKPPQAPRPKKKRGPWPKRKPTVAGDDGPSRPVPGHARPVPGPKVAGGDADV